MQNLDYKLAWIQSLEYSVDILAAEILHQIGINQTTLCVDLVFVKFIFFFCLCAQAVHHPQLYKSCNAI